MYPVKLHGMAGLALLAALAPAALSKDVEFRRVCLDDLAAQVPKILASQDKKTGRFGEGIWIVTDQNVLLPLSAAWWHRDKANSWHHSPELLEAIMAGGDALIDDQDADGRWEFRKKDGSTWGKIYMPWTYSRWIRAFTLVRDAMPPGRRARWEKALRLGFTGIAAEVARARVQNIPAHHAMGLYFAAQAFAMPEWERIAREYLHRVTAAQHSDGYWSEHQGPVVGYGFVYVDALGAYYAASRDREVLPALEKAAAFHAHFTYPDGSDVETIDERNPYHAGVRLPNVGFTFSPAGRAYFERQLRILKRNGDSGSRQRLIAPDEAASLLLWGEEGSASEEQSRADFDYVLPSGEAAVRKRGPWFLVVSAMTAELSPSRWIQDRQNFISVFHEKAGLVLGGGNTKLQPRWSTFTAGNPALLAHKPGDEKPNFLPPAGLRHVPDRAKLLRNGSFGVDLWYGDLRATLTLEVRGPDRLEMRLAGPRELTAHATVLPRPGQAVISSSGKRAVAGSGAWEWTPEESGKWLEHAGFRLAYPAGASVRWPVLPHDPYKKDGSATPEQGRLVVDVPLERSTQLVLTMVTGDGK